MEGVYLMYISSGNIAGVENDRQAGAGVGGGRERWEQSFVRSEFTI